MADAAPHVDRQAQRKARPTRSGRFNRALTPSKRLRASRRPRRPARFRTQRGTGETAYFPTGCLVERAFAFTRAALPERSRK